MARLDLFDSFTRQHQSGLATQNIEQDRDTLTALHFFLKDRLKSGKRPLSDFDRIAWLTDTSSIWAMPPGQRSRKAATISPPTSAMWLPNLRKSLTPGEYRAAFPDSKRSSRQKR